MKKFYILLILITLFISCKKSDNTSSTSSTNTSSSSFASSEEEVNPEDMDISDDDDVQRFLDATGDYPDGTYCAEVEYYNPKTGTRRSYDLDVEVENGDLTQIDWPNGGWLDSTHFSPESISTGEISFRSDKGYNYNVILGSFGGGCSGGNQLQRSVNNDIEEEEQKKQEETCPTCGGHKFSFNDVCSSCERRQQEEEPEE